MLFYKATTAGNKGGIEPAKGNGPVDGRQCLRSEGKQIIHVDPHTLAGSFAAVVDIVFSDDGREQAAAMLEAAGAKNIVLPDRIRCPASVFTRWGVRAWEMIRKSLL